MSDLVDSLRAASRDERLSTGMLYSEAADRIEQLELALIDILNVWPNEGKIPGWVIRWTDAMKNGQAVLDETPK